MGRHLCLLRMRTGMESQIGTAAMAVVSLAAAAKLAVAAQTQILRQARHGQWQHGAEALDTASRVAAWRIRRWQRYRERFATPAPRSVQAIALVIGLSAQESRPADAS